MAGSFLCCPNHQFGRGSRLWLTPWIPGPREVRRAACDTTQMMGRATNCRGHWSGTGISVSFSILLLLLWVSMRWGWIRGQVCREGPDPCRGPMGAAVYNFLIRICPAFPHRQPDGLGAPTPLSSRPARPAPFLPRQPSNSCGLHPEGAGLKSGRPPRQDDANDLGRIIRDAPHQPGRLQSPPDCHPERSEGSRLRLWDSSLCSDRLVTAATLQAPCSSPKAMAF